MSIVAMALLARGQTLPPSVARPEVSDAPIIREIVLEGLKRLGNGIVSAGLRVKVGDRYDPELLDSEYERLFAGGEFVFIEPPVVTPVENGVNVRIVFVEKNRIADVRMDGFKHIDRARIKDVRLTKPGGLMSQYDIESDRQRLLEIYREKGYLFAEITMRHEQIDAPTERLRRLYREKPDLFPEVLNPDDLRTLGPFVVVIFEAHEGPHVTIASVQFHDNSAFDDAELTKLMATRPRSLFFGIPQTGYFVAEQFELDLDRLRVHYVSHGFFDVKVAAEDFAFNRERTRLYLGIRVVEGPRYSVSRIDVEVDGPGVFPMSVLREQIHFSPQTIFDGTKLEEDRLRLQRLYADNAYIDARVKLNPSVAFDRNEVAVIFEITEGEEFYVEAIEFRGNEETRDIVLRRELTIFPGEKFKYSEIADSQSNLYRTGYFGEVRPIPEPGSTPGQKNLIFDVKEVVTGRFLFGVGISSGQGVLGNVALSKKNFDFTDVPDSFFDIPNAFTGGGQTLLLEASPGDRLSRYRATFIEPHIMNTDYSLGLRAYKIDSLREQFRDDRLGFETSLGRSFGRERRFRTELAHRFEVVDIRDVDFDAAPDVFRAEGSTRISSLVSQTTYDRRTYRYPLGPVSGWQTGLTYEYGGGFMGGELDFSRLELELNTHLNLYSVDDKNFYLLQFRNVGSWIEEHHNTPEVPIYERYYLGGAKRLRGFRYNGVGPQFNRDPLGGNARHHGSLQFSSPIIEDTIRSLLFVDYGNLSTDLDGYRLDDYRFAVGAGVLINLNLLGQQIPITLSWAEAVRKEEDDRTRQFLFDIGFGF
ncbi:MAG: outer membrane protein assembly factor BamA [Planctomycetota bacterium]